MTKEDILYKQLDVKWFRLHTETIKTDKGVVTYYFVEWQTQKGAINQKITKEEYEVLLKELEKENDK